MKEIIFSAIFLITQSLLLNGCTSIKRNADDVQRRHPAGASEADVTENAVKDAIKLINSHINSSSLTEGGVTISLVGLASGVAGLLTWRHAESVAAREGAYAAGDLCELSELMLTSGRLVLWTGAGISVVGTALMIMTPTPAKASGIADQFKNPKGLKRFFALTQDQQFEIARWDGEILQMLIQLSAAIKRNAV